VIANIKPNFILIIVDLTTLSMQFLKEGFNNFEVLQSFLLNELE
jgi:hypothetical protein